LRERYPVLEDRGAEALGVVPFRRQAVREIQQEIDARLRLATGAVASLNSAGAGMGS
jgi:hypothetical protein